MIMLKAVLFFCLLLWASFKDMRTREIPDWLPAGIMLIGCIHLAFLPALLGFIIVSFPFYISAVCSHGKIGGGDIKLMAACGFVLGVSGGILQTIIGLTLALLFSLIQHLAGGHKSKRNIALPLAPFLAVGGIAAFWMIHII